MIYQLLVQDGIIKIRINCKILLCIFAESAVSNFRSLKISVFINILLIHLNPEFEKKTCFLL